jgi:hypothetical protein
MMRRFACTRAVVRSARFACATRCVTNTQVSNDEISRVATKVMEETNSQAVHVASAADTACASKQVVRGGNQEVDALFKHVGCTEATVDAKQVEAASTETSDTVEELYIDSYWGDPKVQIRITNVKGLYNALVLHKVDIGPDTIAALKTKLRGVRNIALRECRCTSAIGDVLVDLLVETDSISSLTCFTVAAAGYHGWHPRLTITDQDLTALSEVGVHLRVLHVPGQPVTTVAPFATTLVELDASGYYCDIGDAGLTSAHNIVKLYARDNQYITTVAPFAATLVELDASGGFGGIGDQGLASARGIVKLNASDNPHIKSVAPFAATLAELEARGPRCGICDAGLVSARSIVKLNAGNNPKITTVAPFAATLAELKACGGDNNWDPATPDCGIGDAGLAGAHGIVKLDARNNPYITTVAPFAATLMELNASGPYCGMSEAGLTSARNIVKLNADGNKKIRHEPQR